MQRNENGRTTILLVDDDPALSQALSTFLLSSGFHTLPAHTGAEGLRQLDQHVAHMAVIDIHLPDMTGVELAQLLRARMGPAFPIIVLSGDSSMPVLNSLSTIGATHFFNKPVNRHLLVQRIHELAAQRDTSGGVAR